MDVFLGCVDSPCYAKIAANLSLSEEGGGAEDNCFFHIWPICRDNYTIRAVASDLCMRIPNWPIAAECKIELTSTVTPFDESSGPL